MVHLGLSYRYLVLAFVSSELANILDAKNASEMSYFCVELLNLINSLVLETISQIKRLVENVL